MSDTSPAKTKHLFLVNTTEGCLRIQVLDIRLGDRPYFSPDPQDHFEVVCAFNRFLMKHRLPRFTPIYVHIDPFGMEAYVCDVASFDRCRSCDRRLRLTEDMGS